MCTGRTKKPRTCTHPKSHKTQHLRCVQVVHDTTKDDLYTFKPPQNTTQPMCIGQRKKGSTCTRKNTEESMCIGRGQVGTHTPEFSYSAKLGRTLEPTHLLLGGQPSSAFHAAHNPDAANARHHSWLRRVTTKNGGAAWRPRMVYRRSSEKWCCQQDNHLRVSTSFGGLDCILPKDTACWNKENWRSWPSPSVAMDQGGDGLSGVHALMYKEELRLNLIL